MVLAYTASVRTESYSLKMRGIAGVCLIILLVRRFVVWIVFLWVLKFEELFFLMTFAKMSCMALVNHSFQRIDV